MPQIEIRFKLTRDGYDDSEETDYFEAEGDVLSDIDTRGEEAVDEANADLEDDEDEWELAGWELIDWDDGYGNPDDFDDLNEYAEFAAKVEEHGEAYRLRYEDIGDFDFDDQYNGCWGSEEDFVRDLYEQCYETPDHLKFYIDWEAMTRDYMMDYSSYMDSSGDYHIFRD